MTTKDDSILYGYVLNDTITYNGGLKEQTSWQFTEHNAETASNPITIGESLKQTFAKVDKVNKQIQLYASETDEKIEGVNKTIEEKVAEIKLTTDGITSRVEATESRLDSNDENLEVIRSDISTISQKADEISASVSSLEVVSAASISELETQIGNLDEKLLEELGNIDDELISIQKSVETKMSAEDFEIAITTAIAAGTSKVETTTGFTFDEEGLTVSKSFSEMTTQITEDGMTVSRSGDIVLTANNQGVKAENLHATNYLIIDNNSRFEDYNGNRTACFWVGG
jgi:hypothetical protein